jgi:hypothetical protein
VLLSTQISHKYTTIHLFLDAQEREGRIHVIFSPFQLVQWELRVKPSEGPSPKVEQSEHCLLLSFLPPQPPCTTPHTIATSIPPLLRVSARSHPTIAPRTRHPFHCRQIGACTRAPAYLLSHGLVVVQRCGCALSRGKEDRRGIFRCFVRGNQPVEQPASRNQVCECLSTVPPF